MEDSTSASPDALTAEAVAQVLQEPNLPLLREVLRTVGPARCAALLAETLQVEAQGGLRTMDGTRRRTPGGVFFRLTKERATPEERRRLFPPPAPPPRGKTQDAPQVLPWREAQRAMEACASHPVGEATTMKLTLIGRPEHVEVHGSAVLFCLQGTAPGTLPRGLPLPPRTPGITWNVWVALRQWNRVRGSLASNPEDQLILEGYPLMQGTQPVLFVQSCTTVALQRAQRQAQQEARSQPEA
jgi:PHAX RNA-binding domain